MRKAAASLIVLAALALTGCNPGPDPFIKSCEARGGTILKDSKTNTVVTSGNGGVGVGTTTVTIKLCVVNGDVVDMKVS